jgi:hypothetical protein
MSVVAGSAHGGGRGSTHANEVSRYLPPASRAPMLQVTSNTNLDGKVLAKTVSQYQADQMSRAPTGSPGADPRMTPAMPGMLLRRLSCRTGDRSTPHGHASADLL